MNLKHLENPTQNLILKSQNESLNLKQIQIHLQIVTLKLIQIQS